MLHAMLRAMMVDFNGVIVDDEPVHCRMFQKVLAEEGLPLSEADYYRTYIGMDDRDCFAAVLARHGRRPTPALLEELIRRKSRYYKAHIRQHLVLFPGAADFVRQAARRYPLAIVSGALRHEIECILGRAGLRECFAGLVAAEDVAHGKPHPEGYRRALEMLNRMRFQASAPLKPQECLVIEDTEAGIQAGHAAGMKVLAVAHTAPAEALAEADAVYPSLAEVTLEAAEALFR